MDTENLNLLDAAEIRVLGVLAEKEANTPDNYPLSLNALVNGCNQLTSRDPVMALSESEVLSVIDRLQQKKLLSVINQAGARVLKYEHRMRIKWMLEQDKLAVLSILMLRGFQTSGEIRSRCGRLHEFSSVAEVEKNLEFLLDKYPPLVARLPRAPGTKESRYAHLLSGEAVLEQQLQNSASVAPGVTRSSGQEERVAQLEQEVQQLKLQLENLAEQFAQFQKQFE